MSAVFDTARFGRLWRAHWAERSKSYLWFFGVCIIVYLMMALLAFSTVGEDAFRHEGQMICFYMGLFVTGAIFAARHFEALSRKESALLTLMRPVSVFEKALLAFVMVVLFYPLMYTVIYTICNYPMVKIAQAMRLADVRANPSEYNVYEPEDFALFFPFFSLGNAASGEVIFHSVVQVLLFLGFISVQAFCVGASVFFKRLPMLKMVLAAFLLFVGFGVLMAITGASPRLLFEFWYERPERQTLDWWQKATVAVFWMGTPIMLWVTAFFHLKEREVA
jgi:hypothetical protein